MHEFNKDVQCDKCGAWHSYNSTSNTVHYNCNCLRVELPQRVVDLLTKIHNEIQAAIYTDDGLDGCKGQEILDEIETTIKLEVSHRNVDGLPES